MNTTTDVQKVVISEKLESLKNTIKSGSQANTLTELTMLRDTCLDDEDLANAVTVPSEITELHQLLIDHLNVIPRTMQLRNRIPNRKRRAYLFFQSMMNGVTLVR